MGGAGTTRLELLRGLVKQAPFVAKNFELYFRNGWRRHVLHTKVVAPYAVTFYVTHKCNLDCTYCTQKEPDVFSQELPTAGTLKVLAKIRRETDSIVITGGEPTLRADIETIVEAARFKNKFRSVLLITNGTLLDRKPKILDGVTGLVVSLDALQADPTNPLSKPAALPKVMENLQFAKERLGKSAEDHDQHGDRGVEHRGSGAVAGLVRRARICVCGAVGADGEDAEPGAAAESEISGAGGYDHRAEAREQAADQRDAADDRHAAAIPEFRVLSDDVSAGVSEWRCVLSMRAAAKGGGKFVARWIVEEDFCAGKKRYGDIPPCEGICYLFGNVLSHYYVNDFWGLAGDFMRKILTIACRDFLNSFNPAVTNNLEFHPNAHRRLARRAWPCPT